MDPISSALEQGLVIVVFFSKYVILVTEFQQIVSKGTVEKSALRCPSLLVKVCQMPFNRQPINCCRYLLLLIYERNPFLQYALSLGR